MKLKQNFLTFLGILAGIGIGTYFSAGPSQAAPAAPPPLLGPSVFDKSSENFRAVAKTVGPSVVTIRAKRPRPRGPNGFEAGPLGEMFRPFAEPQGPVAEASGSGFVIDSKGHILTNNHVIENATEIEILFPEEDAEPVSAKLVGSDPRTDLAVLKVAALSVPVQWADSNSVEVGDAAIAIGSPFMLTHSVTAGIISAKGRNASLLMGSSFGYELIQTDAAINPGNSGGPLCSADGKVLGVNTAIYSQSGGYMGIGFAIPSNLARQVAETLIRDGKVQRGWMGVAIQKADKALLKDLGVDGGVVVQEVQEGGPAAKSGLRAGDLILEANQTKTAKTEQLQSLIAALTPGTSARLRVINYTDRKTRSLDVVVGKLPDIAARPRG
jgi:serine protease Do